VKRDGYLNNFGFTVLELMITVTIMLIIFGGSLSAYFTFTNSQAMDTDARQLISELNRVKSLAANMSYPENCENLMGYRVRGDLNSQALTITALCGVGGNVTNVISNLLKSTVFDPGFDITFAPGNGYLSSGSEATIVIKNTEDEDVEKTISVSFYGSAFEINE